MTYYVTVGKFRVYYQRDYTERIKDTYISYSGTDWTYRQLDLVNGLDKLVII